MTDSTARTDPTARFSDRVENYIKFRPQYPDDLLDTLILECALSEQSKIADIGAGTGIFSRQLLQKGMQVIAVEPNHAMREAAISLLSGYQTFSSCEGRAEATGLDRHSIDLITASQAFHWFNRSQARREFARILKPGGAVALVWNERKLESDFAHAYEHILLTCGNDYTAANHNVSADDMDAFFHPGKAREIQFNHFQIIDREGLLGRVQSASYCPQPGAPGYAKMIDELNNLFTQHANNGTVTLNYLTRMFIGSFITSS